MTCGRCRRETNVHITSMFDLRDICLKCKRIEESHPRYQEACEAEERACRAGNFNFAGIGAPSDLKGAA